ncbi:PCI-domain-containing protein [Hesseltinella vesiculosa]|uniref:PCI-domain-containing protein n=1 Tax=Hesseltinella vesiculosa TaxID=101127 RepID=A0A1X2GI53_9FUNG|nr:PCI-domain-containing protein [Hesseltinella vesiculosa]
MKNPHTHAPLEPFLILSKSVKGNANAKLISDCLNAPGIYVFSELFEAPNVVDAAALPEVKPYYTLLRLFLFGTFSDYVANANDLPSLTPAQAIKLKQLSIVTLSEKNRTLSYAELQQQLYLDTIRDLEDLIIDAIYQGVLTGKLDQRKQQLQVDETMGRDLRPGQLDGMLEQLATWNRQVADLGQALEEKIQHIGQQITQNEHDKVTYDGAIEKIRKEAQKQLASASSPRKGPAPRGDDFYDSHDYFERMGGRAKKRQLIGKTRTKA